MAEKRSTALPPDFVVRHNIPEGMTVSLKGLERLTVQLFGAQMLNKAGVRAFDEDKWLRERREQLADKD